MIMKANELRIGNYYEYFIVDKLDSRKEWWQLSKIDTADLSYLVNNDDDENFRPIPLTEEWLLKFGFTIRDKKFSLNYGGESMRYAFFEEQKHDYILYFHGKFGFNFNAGRKNSDHCILYVHQLQNLYFALTGEELKIK